MKLAIAVLAMGLCTTGIATHARQGGTIRFTGLIVRETCADAVAVNRSPAPRRVPNRCAPSVTGVGGTSSAPVYTEHLTTVSSHSGIEVLDYYLERVHPSSREQARVLTRDYL
jgi:hypothetical protein